MTTRTRRTLIAAGLAAGLLVALPACSSSDSGSGEASTGDFCETYAQLNTALEGGPEALVNADLDQLVAAAPNDDLRAAAETVRDGLAPLDAIDVENLDVNDTAAMAEVEAALEQVFTPEFSAAADQIDDYADANCGSASGS